MTNPPFPGCRLRSALHPAGAPGVWRALQQLTVDALWSGPWSRPGLPGASLLRWLQALPESGAGLLAIEPAPTGRRLHLRLSFEEDAAPPAQARARRGVLLAQLAELLSQGGACWRLGHHPPAPLAAGDLLRPLAGLREDAAGFLQPVAAPPALAPGTAIRTAVRLAFAPGPPGGPARVRLLSLRPRDPGLAGLLGHADADWWALGPDQLETWSHSGHAALDVPVEEGDDELAAPTAPLLLERWPQAALARWLGAPAF